MNIKRFRVLANPRVPCLVLKELRFGSGKVALAKDQRVWMVCSDRQTYWIYDACVLGNLLYTFNTTAEATKHIGVLK